jgi:hypothetical protein
MHECAERERGPCRLSTRSCRRRGTGPFGRCLLWVPSRLQLRAPPPAPYAPVRPSARIRASQLRRRVRLGGASGGTLTSIRSGGPSTSLKTRVDRQKGSVSRAASYTRGAEVRPPLVLCSTQRQECRRGAYREVGVPFLVRGVAGTGSGSELSPPPSPSRRGRSTKLCSRAYTTTSSSVAIPMPASRAS